jgi:Winged helix DNA-binding domain
MPAVRMRDHPRVDELTLRALNRATLARQLLLERGTADVTEAVDRLGGLQAQEAKPPFLALWARLDGFRREQLHEALQQQRVVRATAMRATLHLIGAAGYPALRATLQPVLTAAMAAIRGRDQGLELDKVLPVARELVGQRPRTFNELRPLLVEAFPGVNERALGYAVRMNLPLAMVPSDDRWSFPSDAPFALAEIGEPDAQALVRRHLAAFGPATSADIQTWSGLGGLRETVAGMELVEFKHGRRTLYDLPDAPRPDEDTPAPPRLLPEFDSLLLAHKDRTRVVADEHRKSLTTKNLRVKAVFLVDGFVAGTWTAARKRDTATLTLAPFAKLPKPAVAGLTEEGEELLRFAEPDAAQQRVEISAG